MKVNRYREEWPSGLRHYIENQRDPGSSPTSRLVNENHATVLVQAGMQGDHFARAIDCAGNITNFAKNHAGKRFFFSRLKGGLFLNLCVCLEKRYNWE